MSIRTVAERGRHAVVVKNLVTTLTLVLLVPFVMVALVPLVIMMFPVAAVAVPILAPAMLGGRLAGRFERDNSAARRAAAARLRHVPARGTA